MSESDLAFDDRRRHAMTLGERLDRMSVQHIKSLSKKLEGCVPKS